MAFKRGGDERGGDGDDGDDSDEYDEVDHGDVDGDHG